MNEVHKLLDGIFDYYEEQSLDDADTIPLIRRGIENLDSQELKSELSERVKKKYIQLWIEQAKEDDEDNLFDPKEEENRARKAFAEYWDLA